MPVDQMHVGVDQAGENRPALEMHDVRVRGNRHLLSPSDRGDAIPLDEEIDLVTRYLEIQRTRFGDRLQIRMTIEPEARQARVPPLLLQPIVENAIRHGLAARLDAGRIDLDARVIDGRLRLVVIDDGNGDAGEVIAGPERVGLGNTRARLEALYGGRATLELTRAEGRGTRVTIEIPR